MSVKIINTFKNDFDTLILPVNKDGKFAITVLKKRTAKEYNRLSEVGITKSGAKSREGRGRLWLNIILRWISELPAAGIFWGIWKTAE